MTAEHLRPLWGEIGPPSPSARGRAVVGLMVTLVILTVDRYRQFFAVPVLDDVLLYLVIPLLIIVVVYRRSPLRYGLGSGRWREGLAWSAGGVLLMVGVAWLYANRPASNAYYQDYTLLRNPGGQFWAGVGLSGIQMFAWEFLIRGFLLFSLADLFGPDAVWIHTVPYVMAHFGKPEWETYSSIPGGLLAGWITYRVGSIYPAWLIHWALAVGISWFLGGGL